MRGNPDKGPQKQDYPLGYNPQSQENPYLPGGQRGNEYNGFQSTIMKGDEKKLSRQMRRKT